MLKTTVVPEWDKSCEINKVKKNKGLGAGIFKEVLSGKDLNNSFRHFTGDEKCHFNELGKLKTEN